MRAVEHEVSSYVQTLRARLSLFARVFFFCVFSMVAVGLHYGLIFLEAGLDDGPFRARPFTGVLPASGPDEEHTLGSGYLQVYNSGVPMPVLRVLDQHRRQKSVEMLDVTTHRLHRSNTFTSLTVIAVEPGLIRRRVDILASWSYGTERGDIYLWPGGRVHRFYLSW